MTRPWSRLLLILGSAILAAIILWLVFGPLVTLAGGKDLRSLTPQSRLAARNSIQTLFGGVLGFLITASGFALTARKYFLDRDQQHIDRFNTAIEHLSSDQETTRAGGVRALDGILRGSPAYRDLALKSLTGFLRHQTKNGGVVDRDDINAAIEAIRNRPIPRSRHHDRPLDLHGVRLPHAALQGIDLAYANLADAEFHDADLSGADLSHTNLAHADLTRVNITGADLTHADLSNARLSDAVVTNANLSAAILTGTVLENSPTLR